MRRIHTLLLLFGALASTACDGSEPIVVGVAGPFATAYGASMRQGAELAAREVNAAGGIDGRPIELRFADDDADPDSALKVAERFVADPQVVAVVGHVNSGAMVNAGAAYARGLPAVATSATSVLVSRLGGWVFRVSPSDSANSVELARAARAFGVPVAVLYENEDYGRGLADGFRRALAEDGGSVVAADPYLPSTADFRPYLQRMRMRGAGIVLLAGLETDAARIIDQARDEGLQVRFLGGDGLEGLRTMGAAYDGTLIGTLFHPAASPRATAFATQFRASFGREADSFAALGYDATRLIAEAIRTGGADRAAIRNELAHTGREGRPPFEGVTGSIRFDEAGDPVEKAFAIGELRDGQIVLRGEDGR